MIILIALLTVSPVQSIPIITMPQSKELPQSKEETPRSPFIIPDKTEVRKKKKKRKKRNKKFQPWDNINKAKFAKRSAKNKFNLYH